MLKFSKVEQGLLHLTDCQVDAAKADAGTLMIMKTMKHVQLSTLPPTCHHNQECVLYGVVSAGMRDQLVQRLAGLCDPDNKAFSEHEMVFTLSAFRLSYYLYKICCSRSCK